MSANNRDPFALVGASDDAILMLFRQWIAAHRRYAAARDEATEDALVERANDLEMQIYRTPASGPVGLAIKGYFVGYYHADATPEIVDLTTPDSYGADGELAHWDSRAVKSFFDDAAKFVPDLAVLIGPLLDAPVRREAQISDAEKAELRRRAEAIAAEYDPASLPDGDAGLIEAQRRLRAIRVAAKALYRDFAIDIEVEEEIMSGTTVETEVALCNFIEETKPDTRIGAIVKLRYLVDSDMLVHDGTIEAVAQILALLEGEAQS